MTTRIGIISDLHADIHSLRDALAYLDAEGCALIVCGGDVVDYGLFPEEVVSLLRERKIPTVRGNHDRWAVSEEEEWRGGGAADLLSPGSRRWLRNLPVSWERTIDGVRVAVHHGTPGSDTTPILPERLALGDAVALLEATKADVLVVGHSHFQFALEVADRGVIVNPGALLRDSAPGVDTPAATASFGILELASLRFEVRSSRDGRTVEILRRRL